MGVYKRKDSPFWWMWLERPGQPAIAESSKIPIKAATPAQSRQNRRLAEEAYHARMADLARASYALPSTEPAPARRFTDQADWYETHKIPRLKSESSRDRELEILERLRADFGELRLEEIDRELVAEWQTIRLAKAAGRESIKPGTVNREVDVLKAVLKSAVPKYLEASPLYGMPKLRTENYEPRLLTRAEEERLLRELAIDDRALVLCGLDALARLRDVLDLRRDRTGNVQDRGTHILLLNPKSGRRKTIPVSKRLRVALDRVSRNGPYYFHRRRVAKTERDRRGAVRDFLEAACKRAGIPYGRKIGGITFHTATRHTGASRMIDAGTNPRVVQDVGDWSTLSQLERYTHPSAESLLAAVEAVGTAPTPVPTAERIAELERELAALRRKQEEEAAARRRIAAVK